MAVTPARAQANRLYAPLFLDKSGDIRPSVERELVSVSNAIFQLQSNLENNSQVMNGTWEFKNNVRFDSQAAFVKGAIAAAPAGMYTAKPVNTGYYYEADLNGDVVTKPFWGSVRRPGHWTLSHSYGVHMDATDDPNQASHCFVMTDGATYTRIWNMDNNNHFTSPANSSIWLDLPNRVVALSTLTNTSDIDAKENIKDYDGQQSLSNIKQFDFKTYSFKEGIKGNTCRGVIAQDVEKIDPIYVWNDGVHLSLNNNQLLLDALAAIKVLEARIAYLESK